MNRRIFWCKTLQHVTACSIKETRSEWSESAIDIGTHTVDAVTEAVQEEVGHLFQKYFEKF